MEEPAHLEATLETMSQNKAQEAGSLPLRSHQEDNEIMISPPARHPKNLTPWMTPGASRDALWEAANPVGPTATPGPMH